MRHLIFSLTFTLLFPLWGLAQSQTQNVRGSIIDQDNRQAIEGVAVRIEGLSLGAYSDSTGAFIIKNVPLGRHIVVASIISHQPYTSEPFIVRSAKESILAIEMVEGEYTLEGITIEVENYSADDPGLKRIDIENSEYKAGAIADPGRILAAEPGVVGPQDNNSDIVIRGNTPAGVLWRLEGIDIPNPNHFARKGSSGGGITVFSAQLLSESSFSTGAFAADYGNAISGVMDMRFRKGNSFERDYRFKFGLLGIDLAAEGPLGNSGASYLVNYRYSTLGILNDLGFRLVGPRVDNTFQDLSFNLFFPTENGSLTFFGIGGLSGEIWDVDKDSLFNADTDVRTTTDFLTNMGALGMTYTRNLNDNSYLRFALAAVGSQVVDDDDTLDVSSLDPNQMTFTDEELEGLPSTPLDRETYNDSRVSAHLFYNNKLNDKLNLRVGAMFSQIQFSFKEDILDFDTGNLSPRVAGEGSSQLVQAYGRLRYQANNRLTLNAGLHSMYFALNGSTSLEPRFSANYILSPNDQLALSYGLHSQVLPLGNYFTTVNGDFVNQDLDLVKAHHLVLSYGHSFSKSLRFRAEAYYQSLFNLPIEADPNSSYMLLNEREGYARQALVSEGRGQNYGVDISVQQTFARGTFMLLTGSLFQSQYMTNTPDVWYNTRFNGNYSGSFALGREWNFKEGKSTFQVSTRGIVNGGLRKLPLDEAASEAAGFFVPIHDQAWEERVGTYYRLDLRVAYRINGNKVSHLISLDVQNATNRLNAREPRYVFATNSLDDSRTQSGLTPVISYQLDF
ncbi:MAG: carboxypeptidase-like regulatory domain-containing protein [Bacteroidota bacterium]